MPRAWHRTAIRSRPCAPCSHTRSTALLLYPHSSAHMSTAGATVFRVSAHCTNERNFMERFHIRQGDVLLHYLCPFERLSASIFLHKKEMNLVGIVVTARGDVVAEFLVHPCDCEGECTPQGTHAHTRATSAAVDRLVAFVTPWKRSGLMLEWSGDGYCEPRLRVCSHPSMDTLVDEDFVFPLEYAPHSHLPYVPPAPPCCGVIPMRAFLAAARPPAHNGRLFFVIDQENELLKIGKASVGRHQLSAVVPWRPHTFAMPLTGPQLSSCSKFEDCSSVPFHVDELVGTVQGRTRAWTDGQDVERTRIVFAIVEDSFNTFRPLMKSDGTASVGFGFFDGQPAAFLAFDAVRAVLGVCTDTDSIMSCELFGVKTADLCA